MANKTAVWKEHLLSKGGKEVLIKSVLTVIPLYIMSCFDLPLALCKDLNSVIANF